jgi:hypothetical protein
MKPIFWLKFLLVSSHPLPFPKKSSLEREKRELEQNERKFKDICKRGKKNNEVKEIENMENKSYGDKQ